MPATAAQCCDTKPAIILPDRRRFLRGIAGLFSAPAIVRASSLMAISSVPEPLAYELLADWSVVARARVAWKALDMSDMKLEWLDGGIARIAP